MNLFLAAAVLGRQTFDMQAALNQIRQQHDIVGIACAKLSRDGAFGRWVSGAREAGKPDSVKVDDTWLIGTNVQCMIGVLVANEVQKGTLQWKQGISKLLGVTKIDPAYAATTIENLATMTAGFDPEPPKGWAAYTASDLTQARHKAAVDQISTKPAKAIPGKFAYSDTSYVLLGHLLERMNDLALEDVMQRGLWYPMPLDNAAWGPNGDQEPVGHDAAGMEHAGADDLPILDGATRARMSIRNWGRFLRDVLKSFSGHDDFVSSAYAAEVNSVAGTGPQYGGFVLGWTLSSQPWAKQFALSQSWDNGLNHAVAWLDPAGGVGYIAVCNQGGPKAQAACDEAINAMITNGVK